MLHWEVLVLGSMVLFSSLCSVVYCRDSWYRPHGQNVEATYKNTFTHTREYFVCNGTYLPHTTSPHEVLASFMFFRHHFVAVFNCYKRSGGIIFYILCYRRSFILSEVNCLYLKSFGCVISCFHRFQQQITGTMDRYSKQLVSFIQSKVQ